MSDHEAITAIAAELYGLTPGEQGPALADALLASKWLAEHDRQVAEKALLGAADFLDKGAVDGLPTGALRPVYRWLYAYVRDVYAPNGAVYEDDPIAEIMADRENLR